MLFFFYLLFLILLISLIGYGNFLLKFTNLEIKNISIGYIGLSGIFLVNIYSYSLSLLSHHTKTSNTIFFLIGLFFFIYFFKKNNLKKYKLYFFVITIFFLGLLIGKPHDDFEYYHFPYSLYLNSFDSIYGIGHLNHGFRTPSSIFYLNSVFNLPIIGYYTFSFGAGYYMIFANLILIDYLKTKFFKSATYITFITALILLFINIFFYRIGEHGTDKSAQILILILFLELLIFKNFKIEIKSRLTLLIILISLIVSLKAFYVIYFIFILFIFHHLFTVRKKTFKTIIKIFFNNLFIIFAIINLVLICLTYFINTGCIVYPLASSCMEVVEWSIAKKEVLEMNFWYELWSKGGAAPNFRIENPENYVINFNWIKNWIDIYFFNKVSDFLLGLTTLCLIIIFSFKNKQIKISKSIRYKSLIFFILILFLEWFYFHPSLRYGGYCIIAILFIIPTSLKLNKYKIKHLELQKKINIFIIISLLIFVGRNINRLSKEFNQYNYNPFIDVKYNLTDSHFRINHKIKELKINHQNCINKENTCNDNVRFFLKKNNDKNIIYKND